MHTNPILMDISVNKSMMHSLQENLKKSRPKNSWNQISENGKYPTKKIREIDLFHFTSFFGLDFLKFSGPPCDMMYFAFLILSSSTVIKIKRKINYLPFLNFFFREITFWIKFKQLSLFEIRIKNDLIPNVYNSLIWRKNFFWGIIFHVYSFRHQV